MYTTKINQYVFVNNFVTELNIYATMSCYFAQIYKFFSLRMYVYVHIYFFAKKYFQYIRVILFFLFATNLSVPTIFFFSISIVKNFVMYTFSFDTNK